MYIQYLTRYNDLCPLLTVEWVYQFSCNVVYHVISVLSMGVNAKISSSVGIKTICATIQLSFVLLKTRVAHVYKLLSTWYVFTI